MEWDEKVRQVSRMNEPSRVSDRPLVSHCRSLHFPSVVLSLGVLSSRGFLVHSSFIHSPLHPSVPVSPAKPGPPGRSETGPEGRRVWGEVTNRRADETPRERTRLLPKAWVLHPSSQGLVSQPYRRFPPSFHSLSVAYRSVPYLHLSIRAAGGSDRRERYAEGT